MIDKFGNPADRTLRDSQGNPVQGFIPPTGPAGQALVDYINPQTGQRVTAPSGGYTPAPGFVQVDPGRPGMVSPGGPGGIGTTTSYDVNGNPLTYSNAPEMNMSPYGIAPGGEQFTRLPAPSFTQPFQPDNQQPPTSFNPFGGLTAPGVSGLAGIVGNTAPAPQTTPVQTPQFLPSEPIVPGAPAANASQIDASIRPFLTEGLRQAQELFLRQQPQMFPGQTYVSPSEQTLTALQAQENIARQQSPLLGAAQGAFLQSLGGISNTAAGQYLNANPYQQQMMQAATRPLEQAFSERVLPGISSLYSKSGRLGSGSMERALSSASEGFGRSIGDITANIAGTQYQQERGIQQQAALQLAALAQAAPSLYSQQFIPAQQLGQVGAAREAIAAQPLQEEMNRFAYGQRLPYEQLSGFLSSVYGSPLGSYGSPAPQQQFTNSTVGALGGALGGGIGGYTLGRMLPTDFLGGYGGAAGGALGAIGGGLLGGGFF
jgi:hypothetical protein